MADDSLPRPTWAQRLWSSWATRSLAIGAVATGLDIGLGATLLTVFDVSTRISAMTGVILGATFTFFANRHFAFQQQGAALVAPALKFLAITALSSLAHGQLVVLLRDRLGVPYVPAKVLADLAIFTFGQLLLLRYVVFGKTKPTA